MIPCIHRRRVAAFCFAMMAACLGPAAWADSAAGGETLDEAWQQALANDHGLKAGQSRTAAAEDAVRTARAQALPRVDAGVARLSGTEGVAISVPGIVVPVAERDLTAWSVFATLPLFTGGRISNGVEATQHALQSVQAQEQARRQALKFEVAQAYVQVLRAERLLDVALKHQDATASFVDDARRLLEQGMVVQAHVLTAEVAHADATQAVLQARTALDVARSDYNRLLGRSLADDVRLALPAPPVAPEDLASLTARALAGRFELRALDEAAAGVTRQADATLGERLPQVALVGGRAGATHTSLAHPAGQFVGVTVNWTLFDHSVRSRHDELLAQANALREQREDLAGRVALQVRQAWLSCEESRQRHAVAQAARGSAAESLRVVRDRLLQGLATQTEVLAAESQKVQAESHLANAEFDRVTSALALRLAVGEL